MIGLEGHEKFKLSNGFSRATKIAKNPDFIPFTTDVGFSKWANKGLIYWTNFKMNLVYQQKTSTLFTETSGMGKHL